MNGKYATESLVPYLRHDTAEPDVYVLGFQELDLSAGAFLLDNSVREDDWTRQVEAAFRVKNRYKKVVSKQLVGVLIMVYVHVDHLPYAKEFSTATVATGIMNMMVRLLLSPAGALDQRLTRNATGQ